MNNVIDFQKKRNEKIEEEVRRKKELDKRRRFLLNSEEANVLINSYIDFVNDELEIFKELITDEDKEIGKNEIKTMFSLLRMLFVRYKKMNIYDCVVMYWTYKNIYYSIMSLYDGLNNEDDYGYLENEEKVELNLYYRLIDLDHKIAEVVHGPSVLLSKSPGWMDEAELMAEEDFQEFSYYYQQEFLDRVVLLEEPEEDFSTSYSVKSATAEFKELLQDLKKKKKAFYSREAQYTGWKITLSWEELLQESDGYNLEVITLAQQEKDEISHIYSIELLEEQIADMLNRMDSIGMRVSGAFIED